MNRKELLKQLRKIAKAKGVEMTIEEGGAHTKVLFAGDWVTTVGRHAELPEMTARGSLRNAHDWQSPSSDG